MLPDPIDAVLRALSRREPIDLPAAVIVAHPDDETIGAGPFLHLFRRLLLVHVTDGAPRNLLDARAAGFETCDAYAAARTRELQAALRAGGVSIESPSTTRMLGLNVCDQGASLVLPWLAATLANLLADQAVVLTHAYEGGHPDHDAVAFAAQASGRARIEMALYHAAPDGSIRIGAFLPGPPEIVLRLSSQEQAVRAAMLDSFATQRSTLAAFRESVEYRFRPAPRYDFTRPPAERAYYDGFDWGMTSARWLTLAAEAIGRGPP